MKIEKLWIIGLLMLVSISVVFAETDCHIYTTKDECQNVTAGSPCVWCEPNGPCELSLILCPFCSDTDNGLNYIVKGTVSGYRNNQPYSYTDSCNITLQTYYLTEYACNGTTWYFQSYNCKNYGSSYVCNDGRCVSTTTPTTIQTTTTIGGGPGCGRWCLRLGLSNDSQLLMIFAVIVLVIIVAIYGFFKVYAKKV